MAQSDAHARERDKRSKAGGVGGSAIKMPGAISGLTVVCLALAAFTSTWGGLKVVPLGQMGDVFLSLAFGLILGQVVFGDLRFTTPIWIWIAPIAVILCTAIRWLDPIPYSQIIVRYTEPPYAPNNFPKAAVWLAGLVLVPLVIIACAKLYPRTPQVVIGAFTAGVCVSSAVAISDLMGFTHISTTFGMGSEAATRQSGLTVHSVMLGLTCVLAIPFALYFMYLMRHKWIPAIALIVLFGGVLASGSRGAQAASVLIAALTVLVAPKRAGFRQSLLTLGMSAVVVLTVAQLFVGDVLNQLVRFGGGIDAGGSDQKRERLAQQALEDFDNFPIAGLGIKAINNAHSIYLQCLQSGGFILLIGMLVYWIWCLRDAWLLGKLGHPIARYLFISISAWLILGAIENQLTDRLLYYSIGCVAAMASLYLGAKNQQDEAAGGQPWTSELSTVPAASIDANGTQLHHSRR